MDKLKFYQTAALGMLLLNLGLLVFIVLSPAPGGGGRPERAHERLELNEEQHVLFLEAVNRHQATMQKISSRQKGLLRTYFDRLKTDAASTEAVLPEEMLELEVQKITGTYHHLLETKRILNEEQSANYPEFVDHALQRILFQKKRPSPRRKPGAPPARE